MAPPHTPPVFTFPKPKVLWCTERLRVDAGLALQRVALHRQAQLTPSLCSCSRRRRPSCGSASPHWERGRRGGTAVAAQMFEASTAAWRRPALPRRSPPRSRGAELLAWLLRQCGTVTMRSCACRCRVNELKEEFSATPAQGMVTSSSAASRRHQAVPTPPAAPPAPPCAATLLMSSHAERSSSGTPSRSSHSHSGSAANQLRRLAMRSSAATEPT